MGIKIKSNPATAAQGAEEIAYQNVSSAFPLHRSEKSRCQRKVLIHPYFIIKCLGEILTHSVSFY